MFWLAIIAAIALICALSWFGALVARGNSRHDLDR